MYTKEQMFMMFQAGRRTGKIAFPHSLYREFESELSKLGLLGTGVDTSQHSDICNCNECHNRTFK